MLNNMIDTPKIDFLHKHKNKPRIGFFKENLNDLRKTNLILYNEIIKNIKSIIGNQEIEWILRNDETHIADYLIHRFKFRNYPKLKKLETFPQHLLIEPTSICNLRCKMCFQKDPSFQTQQYLGSIDFEFFKHLVDQAVEHKCRALTLASRGEPTLHKEFGKMLRYCKGKFFELKINTNATKLNEKLCHSILDSGVDIVIFSVDSNKEKEYQSIRLKGKFKTVLKNIKRFTQIKQTKSKYKKTSTRVQGVYLGQQSKTDFLNFWKKIVDEVAFTSVCYRWDTYNNETVDYVEPCRLLWERMYVWFDGKCNPCDFDYKGVLDVGNAKKVPLKDIWQGHIYNKYRKLHLEGKRCSIFPCNRCNLY